MSKKIYREKQRFLKRADLRLIFISVLLLLSAIVLRESLKPEFKVGLRDVIIGVAAVSVLATIILFLVSMRIKLAVSNKGLEYKMTPFHKGKRIIPWEKIKNIHIIKTPSSAVWQKRYDIYLFQDKFTFTGRNGISVETHDGRGLFIGSSNVRELEKAISEACKKFDLAVISH